MTDLLTHDAGEKVRRVRARELGAEVVLALYRLVKVALLHDTTNQALARQVEQTREAVSDYCTRAGTHVTILFSHRAVFVAGELLKGARTVYESALELGQILEWCGGAELSIARDASAEDLRAFAEAVARAKASERGSYTCSSPRVRLRPVNEAARVRGLELEDLGVEARLLRTYAMAVVALRRFYDDLYAAHPVMPPQIKRVAQSLVDLSEYPTLSFLGVSEVRNANSDEAGRGVNSAILAVAMARQITDDRLTLSQLALAALVHDAGRPRAAALLGGGGPLRTTRASMKLTDDLEDRLPAGTVTVLTTVGRVNEPTVIRTVIAFEALWLARSGPLGPVYRSLRPGTLHARILAMARRYNELMTPEPGATPRSPGEAVNLLATGLEDATDWTVLRMLVAALRIFPVGTVVQLSSGVTAEVVRAGGVRVPAVVRPVLDANGGLLEGAAEIDLEKVPDLRVERVVGIERWKVERSSGTPGPRPGSGPPGKATSSRPPVRRAATSAPPASPPRTPSQPEGSPPEQRGAAHDGPTLRGDDRTLLRASPIEDVLAPTAAPTITPSARGTLATTPLVHVLVYMLDHEANGTVELREPGGITHSIYFRRGSPMKVRVGRLVSPLGELLVQAGLVEAEGALAAVEESRRLGLRLGEFFVTEGVITRVELAQALEKQIVAKVSGLVNVPAETQYSLYRDVDLLADTGPEGFIPCDGLNVIVATVASWHDRDRVRRALGRLASTTLSLDERALVSGLDLGRAQRHAMDVLFAGGTDVPTLLSGTDDVEAVASLLYALAVTRQLVLPNAKGGPMGATRYLASARPSRMPPSRRGSSHPPPRASARPPSLPSISIRPLAVTSIAPPAPSVIPPSAPPVQEPTTASPPSVMPPSDQQLAEAERALEAMASFRLAEQACAKGDMVAAERHARRAAKLDPDQVEHGALLAWVEAASGKPEVVAKALSRLSAILVQDPTSETVLLLRAKLYMRLGRAREAARDFEALLMLNPSHREAASGARLAKRRASKS